MKTKNKLITVIALLICVIVIPFISINAATDKYFIDEAGLVSSSSESDSINDELQRISEKYDCDVAIVTVESVPYEYYSIEDYADDYYDYIGGFGQGYDYSGVMLMIDIEGRDWYITTCGYGITAFTDWGLEYIGNKIKPALSEGNYEEAFEEFIDLCDDFISEAKNSKPYDTNNKPTTFTRTLITAFAISFFIAIIVCLIFTSQLKSVKKQKSAKNYLRNGSFVLENSNDMFLYKKVSAVRIQTNNSGGSGGSSTHRSSSGRSHGGRGGGF